VLNIHIDISPRSASNVRLFEATGVRSCLLTDWKENLPELFELDHEIVVYRNIDECLEKARWLLENQEKRKEIAFAGQRRTLRQHLYRHRAVPLNDIIRRMLAS